MWYLVTIDICVVMQLTVHRTDRFKVMKLYVVLIQCCLEIVRLQIETRLLIPDPLPILNWSTIEVLF